MKIKNLLIYTLLVFVILISCNFFVQFNFQVLVTSFIYLSNMVSFVTILYALFILIILSWFVKEKNFKNYKRTSVLLLIATTAIIITVYFWMSVSRYDWKWISLSGVIPILFEVLTFIFIVILIDAILLKEKYLKNLPEVFEIFLCAFLVTIIRLNYLEQQIKKYYQTLMKKNKFVKVTLAKWETDLLRTKKVLEVNP